MGPPRSAFEQLVGDALKRLPRRFKQRLQNVAVVVEDWPDRETLEEMEIEPPDTLYGLYRGVNLPRRDSSYSNVLPDTITIYQGPIEQDCSTQEEMIDLVRSVVVHEIGHYFGLDDARLEELEQEEDSP
jgi:predicted Zn-dependent protease with MMP-like domain